MQANKLSFMETPPGAALRALDPVCPVCLIAVCDGRRVGCTYTVDSSSV